MKGHAERRLRILTSLVSHMFIPMWLLALMSMMGRQDSYTWVVILVTSAVYIARISLVGAWSWFSIYLQRALPVGFLVAAFVTRPQFSMTNTSAEAAEIRLLCLAIAAYSLIGIVLALLGRWTRQAAVSLTFPLNDGKYFVGQGGSTRAVNAHRRHRAQRYAIDVVKVGENGVRAKGVFPFKLTAYAIFGDDVTSPCDGVVTVAIDEFDDQPPAHRDRQNPLGNHLIVDREGTMICLAHLQKGSLKVRAGQTVHTGRAVAKVGNSGNTSEPQLHIHAEKDGKGIPMRFAGRFLVRNDSVEAKR